LIIGKASSPLWANRGGEPSKLFGWFGVKDFVELKTKFRVINLYPIRGARGPDSVELITWIDNADIVFLVGKDVQRRVFGTALKNAFWLRGKFAGLPHPSGRNWQLIDPALDRMVGSFVHSVMALFDRRPDRPLDVPKEVIGADNKF